MSDNSNNLATQKKGSIVEKSRRFLFGDDIFISYSRVDSTYALTLANELTKRRLSCFLDQWGTPPGEELPEELIKTIKRCSTMVLIGSKNAAESHNVGLEVKEFLQTNRPIIPITFIAEHLIADAPEDFNPQKLTGTLEQAEWYESITGIAKTNEVLSALKTKTPSENVILRIVNAVEFRSRSKRLRKTFFATLGGIIFLGLLALYIVSDAYAEASTAQKTADDATKLANEKTEEANKASILANTEAARANSETDRASTEANRAKKQEKIANSATLEAEKQTEMANEKTKIANAATKRADEETKKAEQATVEADKAKQEEVIAKAKADEQQKIVKAKQFLSRAEAGFRQINATSEIRLWRFGNVVDQWSTPLEFNMLLAVEGAKRLYNEEKVPSAESVQTLFNNLRLIPRRVKLSEEKNELIEVIFSSDKKNLITVDEAKTIRLRTLAEGRQISEIQVGEDFPDEVFSSPLSSNGTYRVEVADDKLKVISNLTGKEVPHEAESSKLIGFLPNEKHIALGDGKSIAIFETETGKKIKRFQCPGELERGSISPDGVLLAVDCVNKSATDRNESIITQIWEISSGKELFQFKKSNATFDVSRTIDGRLIALTYHQSIDIWDSQTRQKVTTLQFEDFDDDKVEYAIFSNFSPDGKILGVMGEYGTAEFINIESKKIVQDIPTAFGSRIVDRNHVAIVDLPGIEVWDMTTGKSVARIIHKGEFEGLAIDSENQKLVIHDGENLWIYQLNNSEYKSYLVFSDEYFNPGYTNKYFVVGGNNTIPIVDLESGQEISRAIHDKDTNKIAFDATEKYMATTSDDETLRLWEISSGREIARANGIPASIVKDVDGDDVSFVYVHDFFFSNTGKYLILEGGDDIARIYEIPSLREIKRVNHLWTGDFSFSPDDRYFTVAEGEQIKIYETATGNQVLFPINHKGARSVTFSKDGRLFASYGSIDNTARIWEMKTGNQVAYITHEVEGEVKYFNPSGINYARFSLDDKYLITASNDKTVRIFDVGSKKQIARIDHGDSVNRIDYSPDGRYMITYSAVFHGGTDVSWKGDSTIHIWDFATNREIGVLTHTDGVYSIVFSNDGKYLASASNDRFVRIFNLTEHRIVSSIVQSEKINHMEFSTDGKYISTASDDKTARVWEVNGGREVARFFHNGAVHLARFSTDGKYLTSIGTDKILKVQLWNTLDIIEETCNRLTRNLTQAEWETNIESTDRLQTCLQIPLN